MRAVTAALTGVLAVLVFVSPTAAAPTHPAGYLRPGDIDVLAVLPPAPVPGDPRYDADRATFLKTRHFVGTPRWSMAVNDVQYGVALMLRDFSCAVGVQLTPANAPRTAALVNKAMIDTQHQTDVAKDHYQRLRPFLIDDGEICQPKEDLAHSYDYPSGHSTGGWTWALIMADVVPRRASAILARGRAYSESRIVCGAHNASAVEGGRLSATVTLAAVRSKPAYKRDLRAARAEIRALFRSRKARKPLTCDAEAALVSQNIFAPGP
jgi:acid phosphatase (class A)